MQNGFEQFRNHLDPSLRLLRKTDRAGMLNSLIHEGTKLGHLLRNIDKVTFQDYSRTLVETHETENQIIKGDRSIVLASMRSQLEGRFSPTQIEEIIAQHDRFPVIQTADHAQLLYDPSTFLNNFIFQAGMRQLGTDYMVSHQCSTVRMLTSTNPKRGPGVILLEGGLNRVFDKSNKKLISSNVASLSDVRYIISPVDMAAKQQLPQLLADLRGSKFPDAATAFLYANQHIWNGLGKNQEGKLKLVLFNEFLSSEIVAKMISDPNHLMRKLLFDPKVSGVFGEEISRFINSPECLVLRDSTDFFYGKVNDQLVTLRLSNDNKHLESDKSSKPFIIDFTPDKIIEGLLSKELFPSLITSMMAVSIFPLTTAVGGSSQYEYLSEIQEILKRTFKRLSLVSDDYMGLITNTKLSTMISHLISDSHPIFQEIRSMDYESDIFRYEEEIAHRPLGELMGDYSGFSYFMHLSEIRRLKTGIKK